MTHPRGTNGFHDADRTAVLAGPLVASLPNAQVAAVSVSG